MLNSWITRKPIKYCERCKDCSSVFLNEDRMWNICSMVCIVLIVGLPGLNPSISQHVFSTCGLLYYCLVIVTIFYPIFVSGCNYSSIPLFLHLILCSSLFYCFYSCWPPYFIHHFIYSGSFSNRALLILVLLSAYMRHFPDFLGSLSVLQSLFLISLVLTQRLS